MMTRSARSLLLSLSLWVTGAMLSGGVSASPASSPIDPQLGAPFRLRDRPTLGDAGATLVVIEVTSFFCTHCREFHDREFPRIRRRFIDTGLVRWVALNASKAGAEQTAPAFILARGAHRAGQYWHSLSTLFHHSRQSPAELITAMERPGGPLRDTIESWLTDAALSEEVAADFAEFAQLSIDGTPTFILRKRTTDGRFLQARIEGYQSADYFAAAFEQMLKMP